MTRLLVASLLALAALSTPAPVARAEGRISLEIAARATLMQGAIYQRTTPPFALVAMNAGARMRLIRQGSYKHGMAARFEVSGLAGGRLAVTALLPVSGHLGEVEAARRARTNVYHLDVVYADGRTESLRVNADGYVTEKLLDLDLATGTNFVRFYPEGSAGVGAFRSGREIELQYDGS